MRPKFRGDCGADVLIHIVLLDFRRVSVVVGVSVYEVVLGNDGHVGIGRVAEVDENRLPLQAVHEWPGNVLCPTIQFRSPQVVDDLAAGQGLAGANLGCVVILKRIDVAID